MKAGAPAAGPVVYPAKPVDIAAIERELEGFWSKAKGPGPASPETEAVTRACMSNLIIYAATGAEADVLAEELTSIVAHHPARVILLCGDCPDGADDVVAHVSARCHLGEGGRQICSEHVEVRARASSVDRLPSVVRPLLIGDLPTALWWAPSTPPTSGGDLFDELSRMADQVIYDSVGWPDPVRGVVATVDWAIAADPERNASDLAWRRLKPWRRVIAQALDPAVAPGALEGITDIRLEHGPHSMSQSWLLIGWLASHLGWTPQGGKVELGVEVTWGFNKANGQPVRVTVHRQSEGKPEVRSARIGWRDAASKAHAALFSLVDPGPRITVTVDDVAAPSRALGAERPTRPALVAKQLPDLDRDPLFLQTLAFSRTMAQALLK